MRNFAPPPASAGPEVPGARWRLKLILFLGCPRRRPGRRRRRRKRERRTKGNRSGGVVWIFGGGDHVSCVAGIWQPAASVEHWHRDWKQRILFLGPLWRHRLKDGQSAPPASSSAPRRGDEEDGRPQPPPPWPAASSWTQQAGRRQGPAAGVEALAGFAAADVLLRI